MLGYGFMTAKKIKNEKDADQICVQHLKSAFWRLLDGKNQLQKTL